MVDVTRMLRKKLMKRTETKGRSTTQAASSESLPPPETSQELFRISQRRAYSLDAYHCYLAVR